MYKCIYCSTECTENEEKLNGKVICDKCYDELPECEECGMPIIDEVCECRYC